MNLKSAPRFVLFFVALISVHVVGAPSASNSVATVQAGVDASTLTRSQWLKKIGDAAKNPATIKEVMKQVPAGERVEFTQRVLKAITRMPISPEEKQALLVQASIACIGATPLLNDERYKVIAEVIAVVPVEYLPALVTALSKRFTPKLNNLTTEQYKAMADTTVKICADRNKLTDDPAVRNTFAMLLFLMATTPTETPDLLALLLAKLPDDKSRELAKGWIDEAQKGNFEPLLAAADAPIRVSPPVSGIQRVGVSQIEQLLVDVGGLTGSFAEAARHNIAESGARGIGVFIPQDGGIQTVPIALPPCSTCCPPRPRPYPNQLDILRGDTTGTAKARPCSSCGRVY